MIRKLTDANEVLYRNIHPSFVFEGVPSSQPFQPTPKDKGKLSIDRSALTTAEASYLHHTGLGLESAAVYGLTVAEFLQEGIECFSDPVEDTEAGSRNPAHAIADFTSHGPTKQKTIAKRLKQQALARGCLYSPPAQPK